MDFLYSIFGHALRSMFSRHEPCLEPGNLPFETTMVGIYQKRAVSIMDTTTLINCASCIKAIRTIHTTNYLLNLREWRSKESENKVPKINKYRHKNWEWRKLFKEEIYSIHSLSNITWAMNKRFCLDNLPEKYHLRNKCCMAKLY